MRTPSDIEILIHYFVCPEPHPRVHASAVKGTIAMYLNSDILEEDTVFESGYKVTEKGHAWLQMILAVPYPIQRWTDRDGNVIKL